MGVERVLREFAGQADVDVRGAEDTVPIGNFSSFEPVHESTTIRRFFVRRPLRVGEVAERAERHLQAHDVGLGVDRDRVDRCGDPESSVSGWDP